MAEEIRTVSPEDEYFLDLIEKLTDVNIAAKMAYPEAKIPMSLAEQLIDTRAYEASRMEMIAHQEGIGARDRINILAEIATGGDKDADRINSIKEVNKMTGTYPNPIPVIIATGDKDSSPLDIHFHMQCVAEELKKSPMIKELQDLTQGPIIDVKVIPKKDLFE